MKEKDKPIDSDLTLEDQRRLHRAFWKEHKKCKCDIDDCEHYLNSVKQKFGSDTI